MAFRGFKRLVRGLARTRESLAAAFQSLGGGVEIDEEALDDLEAGLLAADLGPSLTTEVIEQVRNRSRSGRAGESLRETMRRTLREALPDAPPAVPPDPEEIQVTFVVGVNGGVGNKRHKIVSEIMPRHFEQTAKAAGVAPALVTAILDELAETVDRAVEQTLKALPRGFPKELAASITQGLRQRARLLPVVMMEASQ